MGGLDGVWAEVLPAADRSHPGTFSSAGRGMPLPSDSHFFPPTLTHKHKQLSSHLRISATQICTCHQLLHPQVLQLLIKLFETEHSQLDVMEQVRCVTLRLPLSASNRSSLVVTARPLGWQRVGFVYPLSWSWRRLCWTEWFISWVVATSCP